MSEEENVPTDNHLIKATKTKNKKTIQKIGGAVRKAALWTSLSTSIGGPIVGTRAVNIAQEESNAANDKMRYVNQLIDEINYGLSQKVRNPRYRHGFAEEVNDYTKDAAKAQKEVTELNHEADKQDNIANTSMAATCGGYLLAVFACRGVKKKTEMLDEERYVKIEGSPPTL